MILEPVHQVSRLIRVKILLPVHLILAPPSVRIEEEESHTFFHSRNTMIDDLVQTVPYGLILHVIHGRIPRNGPTCDFLGSSCCYVNHTSSSYVFLVSVCPHL